MGRGPSATATRNYAGEPGPGTKANATGPDPGDQGNIAGPGAGPWALEDVEKAGFLPVA